MTHVHQWRLDLGTRVGSGQPVLMVCDCGATQAKTQHACGCACACDRCSAEESSRLQRELDAERQAHAATREWYAQASKEGDDTIAVWQGRFWECEQARTALTAALAAARERERRLDALLGDRERMGRLLAESASWDAMPNALDWDRAHPVEREAWADTAQDVAAALRAALDGRAGVTPEREQEIRAAVEANDWRANEVGVASWKAVVDLPSAFDAVRLERDRLAEKLQAIVEPGRPEAFIVGMFDLAEQYGRSPYDSVRHALTFLREKLKALTEERDAARALPNAGLIAAAEEHAVGRQHMIAIVAGYLDAAKERTHQEDSPSSGAFLVRMVLEDLLKRMQEA